MAIALRHVSLTARDALALATFYRGVFGYVDRRAPKRLTGEAVSHGNGLPHSNILSVWLELPGDDGPFLEIMEYDPLVERAMPAVNKPGFGHVAFEVPDLHTTLEALLKLGGTMQGKVTNLRSAEAPILIVYVRDPEGNILEIEQSR